MIEIEDGVEVPFKNKSVRYPFKSMEVGESFFVEGKVTSQVMSAARIYGPMKFTSRAAEKDGVKGVRVWRIA